MLFFFFKQSTILTLALHEFVLHLEIFTQHKFCYMSFIIRSAVIITKYKMALNNIHCAISCPSRSLWRWPVELFQIGVNS